MSVSTIKRGYYTLPIEDYTTTSGAFKITHPAITTQSIILMSNNYASGGVGLTPLQVAIQPSNGSAWIYFRNSSDSSTPTDGTKVRAGFVIINN